MDLTVKNFYPLQAKRHSYIVPFLRLLGEITTFTVAVAIIFTFCLIHYSHIHVALILGGHYYTFVYHDEESNKTIFIVHMILAGVMILLTIRKLRKEMPFRRFKTNLIEFIIEVLLFVYIEIQGLLNTVTFDIKEVTESLYKSLDLQQVVSFDDFYLSTITTLMYNSVYLTFYIFMAFILAIGLLRLTLLLLAFLFSPRYNVIFKQRQSQFREWRKLTRKRERKNDEVLFKGIYDSNLEHDKFINEDLEHYKYMHPLMFFREFRKSYFNNPSIPKPKSKVIIAIPDKK